MGMGMIIRQKWGTHGSGEGGYVQFHKFGNVFSDLRRHVMTPASPLTPSLRRDTLAASHPTPAKIKGKEIEMSNPDNSNSMGNLFLGPPRKERPKAEKEIGKEDIKIPISISYDRRNQRGLVKEKEKVETIECSITGISVTLCLPVLPISLDWISPLGKYKNAIAFSFLSDKELLCLDNEILSACILSLLFSAKLTEGHTSARERNLLLSSEHTKEKLIELLKMLRKVVETKADKSFFEQKYPKFSFSMNRLEPLSFVEYISTIHKKAFPTVGKGKSVKDELEEALEEIEKEKIITRIEEVIIRTEKIRPPSVIQKNNIKKQVEKCRAVGDISAKLVSILNYFMVGANWKTLQQEQKEKYIQYLIEKETEETAELARLLSQIPACKIEEIHDEEEISSMTAPKQKTLQEMLAEFRMKQK